MITHKPECALNQNEHDGTLCTCGALVAAWVKLASAPAWSAPAWSACIVPITETELRCAKAGYEQAICGYKGISQADHQFEHGAWENQSPELHAEWVNIARTVVAQLRLAVDDPTVWNAFAGDGLMWKERNSQNVFQRYLDIISPPEAK